MSLVSENIRYLRKLNGLTQEQFARKINIKRSLLGAYEEARANPNQQNMQAIAKAFNTTVELLTRQDLRKLRETPNLSIPLGQPARLSEPRYEKSTEQAGIHPDLSDMFAQPEPVPGPEPQPLSNLLNKYYRGPEENRPADRSTSPLVPPVITPPVRPTENRQPSPTTVPFTPPAPRRTTGIRLLSQPMTFRRVQANAPGHAPVDRLFGTPASSPATSRPAYAAPDSLSFNNVSDGNVTSRPNAGSQNAQANIPVVMLSQFGDYTQRFQQADFVGQLPMMHLPTLPEGQYRAFEADADFAYPGALLVGQFVRNWFDIVDGRLYVLLIQGARPEVCCRRVFSQVKVKGTLLLTADKASVPSREIALKDVLEVWEVKAFVSQQLPLPAPNTDRLKQLVEELRFEVERL